jgi:anti-sigma B factor antagonist
LPPTKQTYSNCSEKLRRNGLKLKQVQRRQHVTMSEIELRITVETLKRVELITVAGRIDSSNADQLDATFKEILDNGRHNIVVELSGVNYMSSAGLRSLVAALRECKQRRGDVRLANVSDRVKEVLSLSGLDKLFETFDDTTTAVGSF